MEAWIKHASLLVMAETLPWLIKGEEARGVCLAPLGSPQLGSLPGLGGGASHSQVALFLASPVTNVLWHLCVIAETQNLFIYLSTFGFMYCARVTRYTPGNFSLKGSRGTPRNGEIELRTQKACVYGGLSADCNTSPVREG